MNSVIKGKTHTGIYMYIVQCTIWLPKCTLLVLKNPHIQALSTFYIDNISTRVNRAIVFWLGLIYVKEQVSIVSFNCVYSIKWKLFKLLNNLAKIINTSHHHLFIKPTEAIRCAVYIRPCTYYTVHRIPLLPLLFSATQTEAFVCSWCRHQVH